MAGSVLGQGVRFFFVALAGLGIDVTIASALALSGVPLAAAVAVGFAAGLAFNYVAHLCFTFRQPWSHASLRQLGAFLLASLTVLGVRLGAVELLKMIVPADLAHPTVLILLATGVSFVANFLILRGMIFAQGAPGRRFVLAAETGRACEVRLAAGAGARIGHDRLRSADPGTAVLAALTFGDRYPAHPRGDPQRRPGRTAAASADRPLCHDGNRASWLGAARFG